MHNNVPNFFYFINDLDKDLIRKLDKKVAIIYRNYSTNIDKNLILEIKRYCRKLRKKFYLSNNLRLAINLSLDGAYIPSFDNRLNVQNINYKKGFCILGSAHSLRELKIKEAQNVQLIFVAPLFKVKKNKHHLNILRFNLISLNCKKKIIALGGINSTNIKKLKNTRSNGFAAISYFKNNGKVNSLIYKNKYI